VKYTSKLVSMVIACAIWTHILHKVAVRHHLEMGTIIAILVCGAAIIGILHSFISEDPNANRNNTSDE
jgi:hypothetical protein